MNDNDAAEVSTEVCKRKAHVDETRERRSTTAALDPNALHTTKNTVIESSPRLQSTRDSKRGKLFHFPSVPSNTTNNALIESTRGDDNEHHSSGKNPSSPRSFKSRLQWLQDHNIMHNVMLFLDETGLFQLENVHSEMIGPLSIARQWSCLSFSDENKKTYAHKRWRPINDEDVKTVLDEMESTKTEAFVCKDEDCDKDSDRNITFCDFPCKKDLLARHVGRNFAEEAIFVREREKEASQIYDFDRAPVDEDDIPMLIDRRSLTDTDISSSLRLSSLQVKNALGEHWSEWYDYRTNSVNEKFAFVRLSLRDGSGRFWHGFRRLTTNYNKTFFDLHLNMKELIEDMQWTELECFLKLNDTIYNSMQNNLKEMEPLMRMTQLTVSVCGKLLVATGGYSPLFRGYDGDDGKCFFHPRHYQCPLSETTENDLQWMPYRICLDVDKAQNELVIRFDCDHADLPFMKAEDIGKPNAFAHW